MTVGQLPAVCKLEWRPLGDTAGRAWEPRAAVRPISGRSPRHGGMVLVVVAVVILMVSVSAYGFLLNMRTEYHGVKAERGRVLSRQAAHSAQELLLQLATLPPARRRELGGLENNPQLLSPTPVVPTSTTWTGSTDVPRFWVARTNAELQTGEVIWGAVDESAKLHLANLVAWDAAQPGLGRQTLMRIPGMTEATADALLDWLDPDDQPRLVGAERDYYQQLGSNRWPQNGLPWTLEQLLWVRGVDRRLLWGDRPIDVTSAQSSITPTGTRSATSPSSDSWSSAGPAMGSTWGPATGGIGAAGVGASGNGADGIGAGAVELRRPWVDYLTIYSAERNTSPDGRSRINLNEGQLASLHQQLAVRLSVEWANYIVLWRQYGPATSGGSEDRPASSQVTVDLNRPAKFTLRSPLDLLGGGVRIGESGQQQWIASPISADPGQLKEDLPRLLDATTTDASDRIVGRINVNAAPREVLLAVPKLTEELVERILATRLNLNGSTMTGRDPSWLLTEGVVDLATFKELLPCLTTGGDVFQAECWGYVQPRLPMAAFRTVIDGSSDPARCVDYQELAIGDRQRWDGLLSTLAAPDGSSPVNGGGGSGVSDLRAAPATTGDRNP